MTSLKAGLESAKTMSGVKSPIKPGAEGAKTSRAMPTSSKDGMLRCFQLINNSWQPTKQFTPKVNLVSVGSVGKGNEIEIFGPGIDTPQLVAKKFNDCWYLMEVGKNNLTLVDGVPSRQKILRLNESAALSIGGNRLVFTYSSSGEGAPTLTPGNPGPTDFYFEDLKNRKYPFDTGTSCLMGANALCGFCTGTKPFLEDIVQPADKPVFEQQFVGVFFVCGSRLMFTSFDERLTLDGNSAMTPVPVKNGSELAVGRTTLKLGVPSFLSGSEIVDVPKSVGESILALIPVVNPDGDLPDIEIPSSVRSITIGRSSKVCDVVIMASNLSRKHAQCIIYEKSIMLFDCGSSNGTFVNGEKITKKTIHPGDIVSFGDIQYFFCYAE